MRGPMSLRPSCCVVFLLFGALLGCGETNAGRPVRPPLPTRDVTLVAAEALELPRTVLVNGTLQARDELVLGFQVAGRLSELHVDFGDTVVADQLLAALDRRDFDLDVARAEATYNQARAQLGLAGTDGAAPVQLDLEATASVREAQAVLADAVLQRDRAKELVDQKLKPPAELDAATSAYEVARSRLQRARDQVRTWLAELEVRRQELEVSKKRRLDAEIKAPWPGNVSVRSAAVGQYLSVGSPVLTLLRTDPLRLRLEVPERAAAEVRPGQQVDFTVDGSDGKYQGKVTRLGSAIDRVNRTLVVEAEVPNQDANLRPGGFCRASIVVADKDPVVAVPQAALVSFAGVDRVFTIVDGKAQEQLVTPGRRIGELVEIREGLMRGAEVVADPRQLVQGSPVRVMGR